LNRIRRKKVSKRLKKNSNGDGRQRKKQRMREMRKDALRVRRLKRGGLR
jgi:hypothetical protein